MHGLARTSTAARVPERTLALTLALAIASCTPSISDVDAELADAGPSDAGPISVLLGTGAHEFTPIAEGQTLLLARGCQGLQHVWIALRATGIAPRGVGVSLSLTRASDGTTVSAPFDTAITFSPDATGSFEDLSGLMLVVPTPDAALAMPLMLSVTITDRQGRTSSSTLDVTLAWGTEICGM